MRRLQSHPHSQGARARLRRAVAPGLCIAGLCFAMVSSACHRDTTDHPRGGDPVESPSQPTQTLIFPEDVRVRDDSVNAFVEQAMRVCAGGDYEQFRLLWTATENPIPRDEYHEGWRAVREIRIRALQPVILVTERSAETQDNEPDHVLLAEVRFDPDQPAGRREPQREVVLLVVREHDVWRLATAPKAVRRWVRELVMDEQAAESSGANTR